MTKQLLLAYIAALTVTASAAAQSAPYYPDRFDWQHQTRHGEPAEVA